MDFDHVISTIVTGLTWLEGFATTPKQRIDDEGMAAIARIAGRLKVELSKPENVADIGRVAAMAKQDLPSIAAPVAPVEPPAPQVQDGVRGGSRGGLMAPGS